MIVAERYHDISCGHRVVGHEGKCRFLHGHNYRIHFTVAADQLDEIGRVVAFSVIKTQLCAWLEEHFDHKFLIWADDDLLLPLQEITGDSVVIVAFNPTGENIARYGRHRDIQSRARNHRDIPGRTYRPTTITGLSGQANSV